jgi:sucrose-6-phosphate hydrolase SacC (GH32 family)
LDYNIFSFHLTQQFFCIIYDPKHLNNHRQQQIFYCKLKSKDGIMFAKITTPVISSDNRPPNSLKFAFRDPKIFKANGKYYSVIGASYFGGKQIALYKSDSS